MVRQVIPETLEEALDLMQKDDYILVSGGTDLMVQNYSESGLVPDFRRPVMYLANLQELKQLKSDRKEICIGAEATLEEIRNCAFVPAVLKEIIGEMASPGIRNLGTLSGNIGNASPAGDSLVGLYLLDAVVELESMTGKRLIPIEDYITSPRKTVRRSDEMIVAVHIPTKAPESHHYRKVGPRRANAISKLSFGGAFSHENSIISDVRMAFGALAPVVVRDKSFEQNLIGLSKAGIKAKKKAIIDHYRILLTPIDDQRSTAVYRKKTALALLAEFIDLITD